MKLLKYKSIILLLFIMSFSLISCDLLDEEEPGAAKKTVLNAIAYAHAMCSGDRNSSGCSVAVSAANVAILLYNKFHPDDQMDEVSTETV